MKIVGVGCGPGLLTEQAISAIADARLIVGSGRAIELASGHIMPGCEVHEILDYSSLRTLPDEAVVLSTGDPMLAGLGYLAGEIIPGISSMQVAFARLGLSLARAVVVNAHGKDHIAAYRDVAAEVGRGRVVFVIADPAFDIEAMAGAVAVVDRKCLVAICERLGYPEERVVTGPVTAPPTAKSDLFVLVVGRLSTG